MAEAGPIVQLRGVAKRFGNFHAVERVFKRFQFHRTICTGHIRDFESFFDHSIPASPDRFFPVLGTSSYRNPVRSKVYLNTICPVYIPIEQVKYNVLPFAWAGILTFTVPVSGSNS